MSKLFQDTRPGTTIEEACPTIDRESNAFPTFIAYLQCSDGITVKIVTFVAESGERFWYVEYRDRSIASTQAAFCAWIAQGTRSTWPTGTLPERPFEELELRLARGCRSAATWGGSNGTRSCQHTPYGSYLGLGSHTIARPQLLDQATLERLRSLPPTPQP
jgi:hypothetical protein